MSLSLTGRVGPVVIPFCLYNAAGVMDTSKEELIKVLSSEAGAVVSKSCTYNPRIGNPLPRYFYNNGTSTNSTGLANHGYRYYLENAPEIISKTPEKPYFVSIATLNFEELEEMIAEVNQTAEVSAVTFNFSCPNLVGKRQVAYDLVETEKLLDFISERVTKPFGLKLPPYFEPLQLEKVAGIIKNYPVSFLVCINSLGNGLIIDGDETAITPKRGLGGIGGPSLKPFGLANVREFHRHLPEMCLVGCGGIETGQDVYEYFLCGASAVQIGTRLMEEGTDCFRRIREELTEILTKKGLSSLEEIKGGLKTKEEVTSIAE